MSKEIRTLIIFITCFAVIISAIQYISSDNEQNNLVSAEEIRKQQLRDQVRNERLSQNKYQDTVDRINKKSESWVNSVIGEPKKSESTKETNIQQSQTNVYTGQKYVDREAKALNILADTLLGNEKPIQVCNFKNDSGEIITGDCNECRIKSKGDDFTRIDLIGKRGVPRC